MGGTIGVLCPFSFIGWLAFLAWQFHSDDGSVWFLRFFSSLFLWRSYRRAKQLPFSSINADQDGLWSTHLSKEAGLIKWNDVHSIKTNLHALRLDLLDANGNVLIKLNYQLSDFNLFWSLLLEKALKPVKLSYPIKYEKGSFYHTSFIVGLVVFLLIIWYFRMFIPDFGYVIVAVGIGGIFYTYLTRVSRFEILRDNLIIAYPYRSRMLYRVDIATIKMVDLFANEGVREPAVQIFIRDSNRPIELPILGMDAINIYQALKLWLKGNR
jgi:hypothetical protein